MARRALAKDWEARQEAKRIRLRNYMRRYRQTEKAKKYLKDYMQRPEVRRRNTLACRKFRLNKAKKLWAQKESEGA